MLAQAGIFYHPTRPQGLYIYGESQSIEENTNCLIWENIPYFYSLIVQSNDDSGVAAYRLRVLVPKANCDF